MYLGTHNRPCKPWRFAPSALLTHPGTVTLRQWLPPYLMASSLLAASLGGAAVVVAPAASAAACPATWTKIGTTHVCELRFTAEGAHTWTVPAGFKSVDVLVVGAGGQGDRNNGQTAGGGGGGGGIAVLTDYTVTPESSFAIRVGSGASTVSSERISSFGIGASWQARGNGGSGANGTGGGTGGTGEIAGGLTGSAFRGSAGMSVNEGTSARAGTLVDQGLFQFSGTSPRIPQSWGGGAALARRETRVPPETPRQMCRPQIPVAVEQAKAATRQTQIPKSRGSLGSSFCGRTLPPRRFPVHRQSHPSPLVISS